MNDFSNQLHLNSARKSLYCSIGPIKLFTIVLKSFPVIACAGINSNCVNIN